MLFCTNITKSFGPQVLLEEADFQINRGERVGIVGRNGYGKSTLFRLITGEDSPDEGQIILPEHYRIGVLDQHLVFDQPTIVEQVASFLPPEHEHDIWRAEKMLSGLGFEVTDFNQAPSHFSGGFQMRIKLAELLVSQPDLILLDEPTNHLDITSIAWLENFLKSWKGEVCCISHDRAFLESVMTHTALFHRHKIKKMAGPPDKIYTQVNLEEEVHERTRKAQVKETKVQEKFIREFRAGARSAGLVQSRIKMLAKKDKLKPLEFIPPIKFRFEELTFNAPKAAMLSATNLGFGFDPDKPLFQNLELDLVPGQRLGIMGLNGKGKTTLLRTLHQELEPTAGTLKVQGSVRMGYFGQSHIDRLDSAKTVLESLAESGKHSEQDVRRVAGSLLFTGDLAHKKVAMLSGGEKARVNLGRVLLDPVNCLLLDEPTNHLDYESVGALIDSVKTFEGGVMFVSHDENFLRKVADSLIVFDREEVFYFPGGYDQFVAERGFAEVIEEAPLGKAQKKPQNQDKTTKSEIRKKGKKLKALECRIEELEAAQKENVVHFQRAQQLGNRLKMETLGMEYSDLQKELEDVMIQWSEVGEALEALEGS